MVRGSGTNNSYDYFFVTPDSGKVHIKQDLMNDDTKTTVYRVSRTQLLVYTIKKQLRKI